MIAKIKYFVILLLILMPMLATASNVRGRRRPNLRTEETALEDVTEKAAGADQIAMASRTEPTRYGVSSYSDQETENYPYELNLVRPESQYQTNPAGISQYSFGNEDRDMEDIQTAEEYVAKAMQMYGTRIKEPIRVSAEALPTQNVNKYDVFEVPEPEAQTPAPASQVYEKDPVTRSYDVYDYSTFETVSEQQYEPKYEPKYEAKYRYQPQSAAETAYIAPQKAESTKDRSKASVSGEIPKDEILKQIEKSVIKYIKELEAEGKIITTSQPKTNFYKLQPAETTNRAQTTPKQKQNTFHYATTNRPQLPKISSNPNSVKPITEEPYQDSTLQQEFSDSLAPNVEFIYKIKARAPLQSMQAARPYQPQSKTPIDIFDHSAALKNMEEFDLSHVVQEDRAPGKQKLFFNSDVYQDINSLPYKPEKVGVSRPQKIKEHPDYKGYALYTEPKSEDDSDPDSGYPIMNPYKYVFRKEPASPPLFGAQSTNWENNHHRPHTAPQKPLLEYDTYSPKFNNNPEGYGYQHQHGQNHKIQARHPIKVRGKRGGNHSHNKKAIRGTTSTKDIEANVALRPPPKV